MPNKFVILSSAFNEEQHIERTLKSVIKQSVMPLEWIIIDDGSTDKTSKIISKYAAVYSWIKFFTVEKTKVEFGTHAVVNFYKGYERIENSDWDFIIKLDTDLDIDRIDFFEFQLNKFREQPTLGISSGITYSLDGGNKILTKGRPYWRTGGAMKFYRKECLDQIGGLKPIYGWDGLDEYQAMFHGWKTRTLFELEVNHLGKKRALSREKKADLIYSRGKSFYLRGYPLEFIILTTIKFLFLKNPSHAIHFFIGFYHSKKKKAKRVVSKNEIQFIHKIQYIRLLDKLTTKQLL